MTGYTRQSSASIQDSLVIDAAPLNAEFNQLLAAFNNSTGHNHDGSTGGGAQIPLTDGVTGLLPVINGGTGANTASGARTNLGVAYGTTAGTVAQGNDSRIVASNTAIATGGRLSPDSQTVTDWNDANQNGWYKANGAANAPTTGWFLGYVEAHFTGYLTQTVHAFTSDGASDTKTWRRGNEAGTWGSWYRLRPSEDEQAALWAPLNRTLTAGTGMTGGGDLSANRTFNVSYGTSAGTAAQGNDSRIVNAVPNTRTVTAGTGLTGGGQLNANITLNVTYGTSAGTAAQGNDSRLSNSREWTAATVEQAEAEAGTATTRRAWTAQRVAQAIAALASDSPVGLYTGSTQDETNFPVGHTIAVNGGGTSINRNATGTPRLSALPTEYNLSSGTTLSGTWRARGRIGVDSSTVLYHLMQRTA